MARTKKAPTPRQIGGKVLEECRRSRQSFEIRLANSRMMFIEATFIYAKRYDGDKTGYMRGCECNMRIYSNKTRESTEMAHGDSWFKPADRIAIEHLKGLPQLNSFKAERIGLRFALINTCRDMARMLGIQTERARFRHERPKRSAFDTAELYESAMNLWRAEYAKTQSSQWQADKARMWRTINPSRIKFLDVEIARYENHTTSKKEKTDEQPPAAAEVAVAVERRPAGNDNTTKPIGGNGHQKQARPSAQSRKFTISELGDMMEACIREAGIPVSYHEILAYWQEKGHKTEYRQPYEEVRTVFSQHLKRFIRRKEKVPGFPATFKYSMPDMQVSTTVTNTESNTNTQTQPESKDTVKTLPALRKAEKSTAELADMMEELIKRENRPVAAKEISTYWRENGHATTYPAPNEEIRTVIGSRMDRFIKLKKKNALKNDPTYYILLGMPIPAELEQRQIKR